MGDLISSNDDGTGTFAQVTLERFKVIEIFKGLPEGTTEVWVDPGSMTSCYSPHSPGKRYLIAGFGAGVFPDLANHSVNYRGEKKPLPHGFDPAKSIVVPTNMCFDSTLAARSDDDVAFLRDWKGGVSSTRMLGQLNQSRYSVDYRRLPLNNAIVILTGTGAERKSVTDIDGKFEFLGLDPGNYRIRFEHRDYGVSRPPEEINVPKGGCGWVESVMPTAGRLRISVRNSQEQPVANLDISLLYERHGKFVSLPSLPQSDSAGIVDVSGLPSGNYLIAVNPDGPSSARSPYPATYYPGTTSESEATRVTLAPNEQLLNLNFRLPKPLPTRKIFVRVVDTQGRPVPGATVFSQTSASVQHTDDKGRATLEVLGGIEESVRAWKEFDADFGKPWIDWKRWRADAKLTRGNGDSKLEIKFREWRRNGDWK